MPEDREIMEVELSETEVLEGEVWEEKPRRELPMRWHKFLICFGLWFGAFINFLTLILNVYTVLKADSTYWGSIPAAYPFVCALEMIFLGLLICVQICARFKLARFRKGAPRLLLIVYGMILFGNVVFPLAANLSLGWPLFTNFKTISVIANIFMILANNKYYHRRRHLFVN